MHWDNGASPTTPNHVVGEHNLAPMINLLRRALFATAAHCLSLLSQNLGVEILI
jgi:hypothetical protein